MEWKLFNGEASIYASEDWHKDRDAANHLKQKSHRPRMMQALEYTKEAINLGATTVVDLGCGDGGFLSGVFFDGERGFGEHWGDGFHQLAESRVEFGAIGDGADFSGGAIEGDFGGGEVAI